MKLVCFNLHTLDGFADTYRSSLTKSSKSPGGKYAYLFNEFHDKFDEILIYIGEGTKTSMPSKYMKNKLWLRYELSRWLKHNKFKTKKVRFITRLDRLEPSDIILGFSRTLLDLNNLTALKKTPAKKVFFMSHFFYKTKEMSNKLKDIKVDLLIAENNLYKNSKFFRNMFPSYKKDVYHLPFIAQDRFKVKKAFNKREKLCIATGTWRIYKDKSMKDFLTYFKTDTLHPRRKEIGMNNNYLSGYVLNSMSNDYDQYQNKVVTKKDNIAIKFYKKIYNTFFEKKDYFSFDIVAQYNNYQMAAVGEEIIDVPGIGFVEAMNCGCVFMGLDDPMYTDLGMKPNKHYVTYKNYKDLKKKIEYYRSHPKELEKISKAGVKFAKDNFNKKKVTNDLFNYIKNNV